MGILAGKRALIVGLATERSIAHGIAQAMRREGAELAFTYLERLKDRVVDLAGELGSKITMPMNVETDAEITRAFSDLRKHWDSVDIIVHSVAFAPREALAGGFVESTSRDSFRMAHEISSYSLTALAPEGRTLMAGRHRALLTLSHLGALPFLP